MVEKKLFLEFQILIDDRRKLDNLSLELNFHKGEKLIWKIPHRSWVTPSADISTFEPLLNVEKWWIPFSIEQMTPFPLKNFMKKKDANLQNQYYGGIVTWIYTLKLGEVVRLGDKWRLATNNDKPLDVIKKMKIGFFSLSVKLATCTVNGLRTDHLSCSLVQGVPNLLGHPVEYYPSFYSCIFSNFLYHFLGVL